MRQVQAVMTCHATSNSSAMGVQICNEGESSGFIDSSPV